MLSFTHATDASVSDYFTLVLQNKLLTPRLDRERRGGRRTRKKTDRIDLLPIHYPEIIASGKDDL